MDREKLVLPQPENTDLFREELWLLFDKPNPYTMDQDLKDNLTLNLISFKTIDWDQQITLAEDVYNRHFQGLNYQEASQRYLDLAYTINNIHKPLEKKHKPRSIVVFNGLIGHLADLVAMEHAEKIPEGFEADLANQTLALFQHDGQDHWFFPKLNRLLSSIEQWKYTYNFIDSLKANISVDNEEASLVKEYSGQLLDKINQERNYGIKNCYFQSPLFLNSNQAFYIYDEKLGLEDPSVFRFYPKDNIANIGIGQKPTREVKGKELIHKKNEVKTKPIKVESVVAFPLDGNGELNFSVMSRLAIKKGFEKKDSEGIYEVWKMFMLSRIYDLTRKPEIVEKLPSIDRIEQEIVDQNEELGQKNKKINKASFTRFILPRIKTPEPEISEEHETTQENKRFIDRHHVVWFVRNLPLGYHATEKALDYALEHNVFLKEGETIVREHFRGTDTGAQRLPAKALFKR